jgi:hypothetical protein
VLAAVLATAVFVVLTGLFAIVELAGVLLLPAFWQAARAATANAKVTSNVVFFIFLFSLLFVFIQLLRSQHF